MRDFKKKSIFPRHIGIILDGNRRWAKKRGLASWQGHEAGYQNLKKIARYAFDQGLKHLTVYAFSTENWQRKKTEINFLFSLIQRLVSVQIGELHEQGVVLRIFGDISKFGRPLQKGILAAEKLTAQNKKGNLNICLNYGGRPEIIQAIKGMVRAKIPTTQINEKIFSRYLYSTGQPDPELIIRTSGEQRLSNFLTWQSVYSELYFSPKMWPEFSQRDLHAAIRSYNKRQRRFGH